MKQLLTLLKNKSTLIVEKLLNVLSKVPKDKLLHFVGGTFISFPLITLFSTTGFLISILIFAAKEIIYDKIMKKGTPELNDFIYSIIPAILLLITRKI